MKYDKLVITSTYTLERRTNALFQIRELVKKGFIVEYWDVGPITYDIKHETDVVENVSIIRFESKREFKRYVKQTASNKTLYLVFMNYAPKTYFCYRELSKYDLDIAYCVNGILPSPFCTFNPLEKIKGKLKLVTDINAWKRIVYKLLWKTTLLKPLSFQFNTSGLATPQYKVNNNTKYIPFNSTDYISSLQYDADIIKEPYIVFIDQYIPQHPDNKVAGYRDIDEKKYFYQINKLFDSIEQEYNCKVVIAAHPVAQSYKVNNPFNGRLLFFYKTQTLTKHAIGVISHNSTAYSFAVIYNKPALVLISDDMIKGMKFTYGCCKAFANELNWPLINMDYIDGSVRFNKIDRNLYEKYKYGYITNLESENRTNADILYSVLNGDFEKNIK